MAKVTRKQTEKFNSVTPVEDYEHQTAKRTNNPPAGLAHLDREETPTRIFSYDPHLDPQLDWTGKSERDQIEIPAPSIHVQEELSAQKIMGSVRNRRMQASLFDIDVLDPDKAIEFYKHQLDWSNRMILGDSLIVMNSLLERERLSGSVQMIYMDPPYGIKYNSNFQVKIGDTEVKDKRDEDLTREPEMIQAYRDTWELGIHSYLTYLRDRVTIARELLSETGSIFIQISDQNIHRVRLILDEVFGSENFVSMISYVTTSGFAQSTALGRTGDYILWYAKDIRKAKFRTLWRKNMEREGYDYIELPDGSWRRMNKDERNGDVELPKGSRIFAATTLTSQGAASSEQPYEIDGRTFFPGRNAHWKASYPKGMDALVKVKRVIVLGNTPRYVRYADDFGYQPYTNLWTDTQIAGYASDKKYVVQTSTKVIERCLLMVTDPGDLVIDPTCGSGTSAVVAEQWGRRWITIDTSRVALSIARERILTSVYPYFKLRDPSQDVDGGFSYQSISRVTLGSIANAETAEEIVLHDQPVIEPKKVRVTGPFTFETLSRYSVNPGEESPASIATTPQSIDHIESLVDALKVHGIPRPGSKPLPIKSLSKLSGAGAIQAEGLFERSGKEGRFALSLGPQFGAITMSQVSDAVRQAIGFDLVVFAGFAVGAEVQEKLGSGKIGGVEVALLLANPDLLVGDLLKKTKTSQTFRLYASPDVRVAKSGEEFRVSVEGVDSFDASTGEVTSFGKSGIQAWFLDDDYDGTVFRVSQAFFPVSNSWEKLSRALKGTADEDLVEQMHSWESLPFTKGESAKIAVRVISDDGNSSEVVVDLSGIKK
jgi:adenine-specific DNA-methyltransferase